MKNLLSVLSLLLLIQFSCSDPCSDIECGLKGMCDDGTCICDRGYIGTLCDEQERALFLNTWESTDFDCDGDSNSLSLFVAQGTDIQEVILIFDGDTDTQVVGTIGGNQMTINEQTLLVDSEPTTLNGSGSITNGLLTLTLNILEGEDAPYTCTGVFAR